MNDSMQAFIINHDEYRGVLVHLEACYQEIASCHVYPDAVAKILGEALAAVSLLGNNLKQQGRLILQLQSEDFIKLLVTEINTQHGLRGLVQWRNEIPMTDHPISEGQFAISFLPDEGERYQGIVPVVWQDIAKSLEIYFQQSEQVFTRILLASNGEKAAGLLLQKLPNKKDLILDTTTLNFFIDSIQKQELLTDDNLTLLKKLFHEHDLEIFPEEAIKFECTCSQEKMINAVRLLGKEDAYELLATYKNIEVVCEFCNHAYSFNKIEVNEIFQE